MRERCGLAAEFGGPEKIPGEDRPELAWMMPHRSDAGRSIGAGHGKPVRATVDSEDLPWPTHRILGRGMMARRIGLASLAKNDQDADSIGRSVLRKVNERAVVVLARLSVV